MSPEQINRYLNAANDARELTFKLWKQVEPLHRVRQASPRSEDGPMHGSKKADRRYERWMKARNKEIDKLAKPFAKDVRELAGKVAVLDELDEHPTVGWWSHELIRFFLLGVSQFAVTHFAVLPPALDPGPAEQSLMRLMKRLNHLFSGMTERGSTPAGVGNDQSAEKQTRDQKVSQVLSLIFQHGDRFSPAQYAQMVGCHRQTFFKPGWERVKVALQYQRRRDRPRQEAPRKGHPASPNGNDDE